MSVTTLPSSGWKLSYATRRAIARWWVSGYRPVCPGALDALAGALEEGAAHISGSVHLTGGEIRIDPVAVLTPAGVIVPDLAPGDGPAALATAARRPSDALTAAPDEAVDALAAVAHSGSATSPSRPGTVSTTRRQPCHGPDSRVPPHCCGRSWARWARSTATGRPGPPRGWRPSCTSWSAANSWPREVPDPGHDVR
ncbi:hypothetical protein OG524_32085 [Streptomyces sp. NBC_01520]|uniref:hypothetical protein n=1 Tax=Streptomyces sp. NBC_01520 TaxID=2903892 RepID=UPI003866A618